ncbi:CAP domain-containing protein [Chryseomicrobium palamuruense]|uniref:CAP domain-containing protein n=1 Tax=Chryseomicrobium palamuruense TaxID=682973 RepID=A0ABV8UTL8_9BACL
MKKWSTSLIVSVVLLTGTTSASATCWMPAPASKEETVQAPVKASVPAPIEKKQEATPVKAPVKAPVVNKEKAAPVQAPVTSDASVSVEVQQVLKETNAYRAENGLAPLSLHTSLSQSAQQKATDMAKNRYFSHTSPTLGSPFDQMKANGISYRRAAENIAMGQRSATEVVDAWMKSPGHRANILDRNLTHIGIGYDSNGRYWVQQFIQQ